MKNRPSIVQSETGERLKRDWSQHILSLSHIGALLLTLFSISAMASSHCKPTAKNTEICSVRVSFAGQDRSYQYEIRAAAPGKPTIIEIPGGPGQGYIGKMDEATSAGIVPKDYGVITIDPRGVGANDYGTDAMGGNYSSDLEVSDILAVIKKEHLQNYMIHGQSYGTIVATKLGSLLSQNEQIQQPRAIVLSGIVNSAFDDQLKEYNRQLERIVGSFTFNEKSRLQQAMEQLLTVPFKGDQSAFSAALMNGLLFNIEDEHSSFGPNTPNLKKFLKMLSSGKVDSNDPIYQLMLGYAQQYAGKTSDFSAVKRRNTMAEEIKCTEMSVLGEEARVSFDLQAFQLKLENADCEKKGYRLSKPYESRKYQIVGIPLYYFQGTIDPATPATEAKKHYGFQSSTEKIYVAISGYSHTNLIGMTKCRSGLWDAIAKSPDDLEKTISVCDDPNVKILGHQKSTSRVPVGVSQSLGVK